MPHTRKCAESADLTRSSLVRVIENILEVYFQDWRLLSSRRHRAPYEHRLSFRAHGHNVLSPCKGGLFRSLWRRKTEQLFTISQIYLAGERESVFPPRRGVHPVGPPYFPLAVLVVNHFDKVLSN